MPSVVNATLYSNIVAIYNIYPNKALFFIISSFACVFLIWADSMSVVTMETMETMNDAIILYG